VIYTGNTYNKKIGGTTFIINSFEDGKKPLKEVIKDSIRRDVKIISAEKAAKRLTFAV
jgi:hypothetical protein